MSFGSQSGVARLPSQSQDASVGAHVRRVGTIEPADVLVGIEGARELEVGAAGRPLAAMDGIRGRSVAVGPGSPARGSVEGIMYGSMPVSS